MQAREELILEYAYLAKYVVDRMGIRPSVAISKDDMLSHAIIGLIECVERFDPSREVKFQTYAISRMRGAVLDAFKSLDWIPRSMRESGQQMIRVMAGLEAEIGRPPSDAEVAEAMGIDTDALNEITMANAQSVMQSLEQIILAGEDEGSLSGVTGAYQGNDPMLAAEAEERKQMLAKAIDQLPEREKLVISLYYKEGLTLKEIAQVLGVNESRACQIHGKAVMRLNGKLARFADLLLAV
jgi:RNA polymerase sigma factor for flagellar operon FliA